MTSATTRCGSRPRSSASTRLSRSRCAPRRADSLPTSTRRRRAMSAIGQFDVTATALQMAMVGGRHRQRRGGDVAVPRDAGARTGPVGARTDRAARVRPGDDAARRGGAAVDDGDDVTQGTGVEREDPRRRGGREDRHRAERTGASRTPGSSASHPSRARRWPSPWCWRTAEPGHRDHGGSLRRRSPATSWKRCCSRDTDRYGTSVGLCTELEEETVSGDARRLGERYELGELLGRGGMAEVHIGRDLRLGRPSR